LPTACLWSSRQRTWTLKIIEARPISHPYPFLSSPTRAATPSAAARPLRPADAQLPLRPGTVDEQPPLHPGLIPTWPSAPRLPLYRGPRTSILRQPPWSRCRSLRLPIRVCARRGRYWRRRQARMFSGDWTPPCGGSCTKKYASLVQIPCQCLGPPCPPPPRNHLAVAAYHPLDLALPGAKLLDFRVARSVFQFLCRLRIDC
jgi:hypothetical protein